MSTINIRNRYTNVKIIVKNVNYLLAVLIVIFNLIQNVSPEENDPQQQVEYAIPSNLSETSMNVSRNILFYVRFFLKNRFFFCCLDVKHRNKNRK